MWPDINTASVKLNCFSSSHLIFVVFFPPGLSGLNGALVDSLRCSHPWFDFNFVWWVTACGPDSFHCSNRPQSEIVLLTVIDCSLKSRGHLALSIVVMLALDPFLAFLTISGHFWDPGCWVLFCYPITYHRLCPHWCCGNVISWDGLEQPLFSTFPANVLLLPLYHLIFILWHPCLMLQKKKKLGGHKNTKWLRTAMSPQYHMSYWAEKEKINILSTSSAFPLLFGFTAELYTKSEVL